MIRIKLKDFVNNRYDKFVAATGLPKNEDTKMEFVEHLTAQVPPKRDPLTEKEAFEIYSQYRLVKSKKKFLSGGKVHNIGQKKYEHGYNQKKFKSISSRKSKIYLSQKTLLSRVDNVYMATKADVSYCLRNDVIGTTTIAFESFTTKGRTYYRVVDEPVLFTQHFFDRYAERNNLDIPENEVVTIFMAREDIFQIAIGGGYKSDDEEFDPCIMEFHDGMGFGYKIKELCVIKTFVHGDSLGNNQILDLMIVKACAIKREENNEQLMSMFTSGTPAYLKGIDTKA
jgi:hypothetical protein